MSMFYYTSEGDRPVIFGCDADLHHIGWGSTKINTRGEALSGLIMSEDLLILNRRNESTFMYSGRYKVVDIISTSVAL